MVVGLMGLAVLSGPLHSLTHPQAGRIATQSACGGTATCPSSVPPGELPIGGLPQCQLPLRCWATVSRFNSAMSALTCSRGLECCRNQQTVGCTRSPSRRSTGLRGSIAHKCWCGAGLQEHWQHQWRYDGNGQPWIKLQGRWWQMHRATGTKARVLLQDSESLLRPAQTYLFVPPRSWPLEEVRAAPASAWT
jgi:hypothetical protein